MKLGEKRKMFSSFLIHLCAFIESVPGYSFYLDDGKVKKYRQYNSDGTLFDSDGHCENSFHYQGLAQDINLFYDDKYCETTEEHQFLGDFWKSLHPMCTWGGDFKRKDGNHYSFGEGL